jgi:hypothetical protein
LYRAAPLNAIPSGQVSGDDTGLAGAAAVIAIRAADLVSPCGPTAGRGWPDGAGGGLHPADPDR